jgi:hypothetical protein
MAKRPPRRGSFQPGEKPVTEPEPERDLDEARRVATQLAMAEKNRRARDRVTEAEEAAAPPPKIEPKTTGRGLPGSAKQQADGLTPAPDPGRTPRDPGKPFASFAPVSKDLTGSVAQSRSDSHQVLAIVVVMMVILSSAAVVVVVGGGVLLYSYSVAVGEGALAGGDKDQAEHIRDTGLVHEEIIAQPKPSGGGHQAPADVAEPEPAAPQFGDGVIIVPPDILFISIEVKCPSGIRRRAKFRNAKATVTELPLGEECEVYFQGSLPAKTKIQGGQSKTCTFEPTNCN